MMIFPADSRRYIALKKRERRMVFANTANTTIRSDEQKLRAEGPAHQNQLLKRPVHRVMGATIHAPTTPCLVAALSIIILYVLLAPMIQKRNSVFVLVIYTLERSALWPT
jgi:hypothetical protein